jgi:hypothetical protein
MAVRSGRFTTAELDGWLASLATAAEGDYLFSINNYIVLAAAGSP